MNLERQVALTDPGAKVYVPHPHEKNCFEEGTIVNWDLEGQFGLVDLGHDQRIHKFSELHEPCRNCGGMKMEDCCG